MSKQKTFYLIYKISLNRIFCRALTYGIDKRVRYLIGYTQRVRYLIGYTKRVRYLIGYTQRVRYLHICCETVI